MVRPGERIHIVGIAGSGASGAAVLAARAGAVVTGCDAGGPTAYTAQLTAAGVKWGSGHDPAHLEGVDRLALSAALRTEPDLPELTAAQTRGMPVVSWQDLVGELMGEGSGPRAAIAGTHGKSTVTALLGHLLAGAGLDPTVLVGALVSDWDASVRSGGGDVFLVEADEYAGNFLSYHPTITTLTTIEMDHPDVFESEAAVIDMFEQFVRGMGGPEPLLVTPAADRGALQLAGRLADWPGRVVQYGPGSDFEATDVILDGDGIGFSLAGNRFQTALYGAHNVLNATAALLTARELGIDLPALISPVASFRGVARRLELITDTAGVLVFDDYAHHPTEVRAALSAARQRVGSRRLWAIVEPHTFARTRAMFDEYAAAFGQADEVAVADIFAARETDTSNLSPDTLADAIERTSAVSAMATGSVDETAAYVADHLVAGDAVITLGIGTSYRIARGIADALATRAGGV